MKNSSTKLVALMLVLTVSVNAQDLGKIIIRNANNAFPKFIASLNGIRLSNDYTSTVAFNMLDEYQYRVKLLQAGSTTMISYTLASEPKYLSKYVIVKDNFGNYSIMLESKSLMLDDQESPTQTLTPSQTLAPTQTVTTIPTTTVTTKTQTVSTPATTSVVITAISQADFNDRLNSVKKASFDRDKIAKIKQVFNEEYLTCNQVGELVKIFPFDDDKMDVAKWCYKRTLDKKNYYKVEDHFTFDRYKKDLGDWVSKQPK